MTDLSTVVSSTPDGHRTVADSADTDLMTTIVEHARRYPDAVALEDSAGMLSYRELIDQVDRHASWLTEHGVARGDLVGLCLPDRRDSIVVMLAVLALGAGFVPMEIDLPQTRLEAIIEDTSPRVIVGAPPAHGDFGAAWIHLADLSGPHSSGEFAPVSIAPEAVAYIMFTSGSTGRPKAVEISRAALTHFSVAAMVGYEIDSHDRLLQSATLLFDASIEEIFVTLVAGATMIMGDRDLLSRADLLLSHCRDRQVTVMPLSTAYWIELVGAVERGEAELPDSLRLVMIGGEAAPAGAVRRWQAVASDKISLVNSYGPTEATVVATICDVTLWAGTGSVPIGHPLPGVLCRVVDEVDVDVPDGTQGQLLLGGPTIATGYRGQPERTAQRFFTDADGIRFYRTGDLVRRGTDGELLFIGRADRQVKVRGFRVEPGEIEAALGTLDGVDDAVVTVDDSSGRARLVAHVLDGSARFDSRAARIALAELLPRWSLPSSILTHAAFPRTRQGKVDRAALASGQTGVGDSAADDLEQLSSAVGELWTSIVGSHAAGSDDDFFMLGGDSLDAVRLLSGMRREFGVELTLSEFYREPTLAALTVVAHENDRAAQHPEPEVSDEADDGAGETVRAMSPMQRHLWITEQLDERQSVHTLGIRFTCAEPVDVERLRTALGRVAARHPMLRARVALLDDQPVFEFAEAANIPVRVEQSNGDDDELRGRAVREPFDLSLAPLARVHLIRGGAAGSGDELLLVVHHLAFDGWSVAVFSDDLAEEYLRDGPVAAAPVRLPRPVELSHDRRVELARYWRERMAGADLDLPVPADRPRVTSQLSPAARVIRPVPEAQLDRWRGCARDAGVTMFSAMLAGLQTLLSRYTGKTDITVVTSVAGRSDPADTRAIMAALTVVPMRGFIEPGDSFSAVLRRVQVSAAADLDHQDLSLAEIVAVSGRTDLVGSDGRGPVVLSVHNTPAPEHSMFRYVGDLPPQATANHLTVALSDTADGMVITADFATEIYDRPRVEAMLGHLASLLDAAAASPSTPIADLQLLSTDERRRVVDEWNDTGVVELQHVAVHHFLEAVAVAQPEKTAITFGEDEIGYAELNGRANRLARVLRQRAIGPGDRVAIYLDRGIDLFVAMWAVLKSGAAYVPLDPAYPEERLRYMLDDSDARLVVQSAANRATIVPPTVAVVEVGSDEVASADPADLPSVTVSTDAAYVMYTSGSTGRAKGVVIGHDNLVHAVGLWQKAYDLDPAWTYLQQASFSFDMFICETYRALCTGGRLVVVPREVLLDPAELYALMRSEGVHTAELVPAVLRSLLQHAETTGQSLDFLRLLICGGEKWGVGEFRRARALVGQGGRVVNAYGVTEATADSSYFDGDVDGLPLDAPLPIGRPFPGCRAYVLDSMRQPVPAGVVGELYLGGPGVGHGYFRREELTAERFVPDSTGYAGTGSEPPLMYRTGDAARHRLDGALEFLGRLDDQVKVNGHRVELGEIEAALAAVDGVIDCAATTHTTPAGHTQVVGYVVAAPGKLLDEAVVRRATAVVLAPHMIPGRVLQLSALPLSPTGKIDRRALPQPPEGAGPGQQPRTPTERRIAELWCEILGVATVSIDDNFFALGGDSFRALRTVRRLEPMPSLVEFYQHPTVALLAALLDDRAEPAIVAGGDILSRLSSGPAAVDGVTVVAVPYSGGSAIAYAPLAAALPETWSLSAVELPGHDRSRADAPLASAEDVAARVVADLRAVSGRVVLYGHCLSVGITVEIARQAEAAGIEIAGVGLGAAFPTARPHGPLFDWWYRIAPTGRFTSNRIYLEYLRARGGFADLDDPAEQEFMLRALRHDERDAEEWFTAAYRDSEHPKLSAPVLSVIGQRDRVTDHYQERVDEWRHFADDVDQVVLADAGHFFIGSHSAQLSQALVGLATRDNAPQREPGTLKVAASPSLGRFGILAFGQLISMIGSGLSTLVFSIWVFEQTGSLAQFAVINAIGLLPGILAGPFAGAVADRFDRRLVMLLSDLSAAAAMASIAITVFGFGGTPTLWQICGAVAVTSLASAFQRPAFLAAVTQLVPKRYLGHSAGITQFGVSAGIVVAPLLGGVLYPVIGLAGVIVVDAATFVIGVATVAVIRLPDLAWRRREEPFLVEVRNGWNYVMRRPGLRSALRFFLIDQLFYTVGFAVLIPYVLLESNAVVLGLALASGGVGGLLAALVMSVTGGLRHRVRGMLWFMGVGSAGMAVLGVAGAPFAVVGLFLMSFGEVFAEAHWIAFIQRKVGFELQGRVLSIFIAVMMVSMPIGYLIVGPLAELYVQPLLEVGGPLAGTVGLVFGVGPSRGLALLIVLSGLAAVGWAIYGLRASRLRDLDQQLPDLVPTGMIGDRDAQQREADRLAGVADLP